MKRSVGGLMILGGWVIVPSVVIWLLGGPLWGWVAGIGAVLVFLCGVALLELIADRWGHDCAILCILIPLFLVVLTQALGWPWWAILAVAGLVVVAILVGLLGLMWLVDE